MKHIIIRLMALILLIIFNTNLSFGQSQIKYIDKTAKGLADGSSWKNAYANIDSALNNALPNDTFWITKGTYTFSDSKKPSFDGISFALIGGFEGYETNIQQRDVGKNKTTFHNYENGDTVTKYRSHLFFFKNGTYYLDGIIIEYGRAVGIKALDTYYCDFYDPNDFSCLGGGIYALSTDTLLPCNVILRNCIIRNNEAQNGGGIYVNSYPNGKCGITMDSCEISNNIAGESNGGVYIELGLYRQLPCFIRNSIFANNRAFYGSGGLEYWSVYDSLASFELENCKFVKNTAKIVGGASIRCHENTKSYINNCQFIENIGTDFLGGGPGALEMFFGEVNHCSFIKNIGWAGNFYIRQVKFENCLFAKNRSYLPESNLFTIFEWGLPKPNETTNFYNCTFYDDSKGAKNLFRSIGQNVNFNNCSFEVLDSNLVLFNNATDTIEFNHCSFNRAFQNNKFVCGLTTNQSMKFNNTLWNVSPAFRDTMNNDFRLSSCSPLVNQGSNLYLGFIDSFDLAGAQRLQDGQLDIGAYETPKINYQFNSTPNLCATDSSGTFSIDVSGGIAPYQLHYNGEIFDSLTLNNIHSGLQNIILSDSTNCKLEINASFGPEPIHFDTIIVQASSKTSKDGTIKLSKIQGGNPPLNLLWSNGVNQVDSIINLAAGIYYLTITDSIGCEEYFSFQVAYPNATISILNEEFITLFPNPAKVQLNLELGESMNPGQAYDIKLYDLQGSTRYKGVMPAYSYVHTIDVQNLASGMYILELSDKQGKILRRKFVKSSIKN